MVLKTFTKRNQNLLAGAFLPKKQLSILGASNIHKLNEIAMKDKERVKQEKKTIPNPLNIQFNPCSFDRRFADLPLGEVPEELSYTRPFQVTTLSNGIKVCTEKWSSSLAAVGVFIGAGSRNETIPTSGAAHFLEHLHFKGSQKRTRAKLEIEIENLGSQLNAYTSREHTLYHILCFPQNLEHSMDVLGDMLCHSTYDHYHLEQEKDTIWQELLATNQDYMETTMEGVYYNIFKSHMMGQPILGDIDNIYQINRDMVVDFHKTNYYGDNIVIVGTGNVDHNKLVELAQKGFNSLPQKSPGIVMNTHKPKFHTANFYMRDDQMAQSNVGVFFEAPSWHDEDFYSFLLLQRIFVGYNQERQALQADIPRITNSMHSLLGENDDTLRVETIFSPYSDCGIFGHYLLGNHPFTRQLIHESQYLFDVFCHHLSDLEIQRAKQKILNEICAIESATDYLQQIGPQMLYFKRRVPVSEIAYRISNIDNRHLRQVCKKWFQGKEPSITNWGPASGIEDVGPYKYFKVNTVDSMLKNFQPPQL